MSNLEKQFANGLCPHEGLQMDGAEDRRWRLRMRQSFEPRFREQLVTQRILGCSNLMCMQAPKPSSQPIKLTEAKSDVAWIKRLNDTGSDFIALEVLALDRHQDIKKKIVK